MKVKGQTTITQRHKVIAWPAWRQRVPQRGGMHRESCERTMRPRHDLCIKRKGLKRNEIEMALRIAHHKVHHRQKVETRAKAGFCNRQMSGLCHSRRKVIAVQKHMTGFGKPVLGAVIAVIKPGRIGNAIMKADFGCGKIVIGTKMW